MYYYYLNKHVLVSSFCGYTSIILLNDVFQRKDTGEEGDDDDQCTILENENTPQPNNPWFTSELIIKEEPISDSEQVIVIENMASLINTFSSSCQVIFIDFNKIQIQVCTTNDLKFFYICVAKLRNNQQKQ